jgi:hypothetical protein
LDIAVPTVLEPSNYFSLLHNKLKDKSNLGWQQSILDA